MYCNTVGTEAGLKAEKTCIAIQTYCIVTGQRRKGWTVLQYNTASPGHGAAMREARSGGVGMARGHAHDTTRGALRHGAGPCDTAEGYGHDMTGLARSQRLRHGLAKRPRYGALRLRYDRCLAMTRPGLSHDTTARVRSCARLGVPVRTWACQLGQLGARALGLAFNLIFSTRYCF